MQPLQVDVEALARGAEQLEAAKESVRAVFDGFQAAAQGYANAFGGDEIGMLLGLAHQACLDSVLECSSTNLAELEDYVTCLQQMAENYRSVEEDVTTSMRHLHGALGG